MSTTTVGLDEALRDYILKVGVREPAVLVRLRQETRGLSGAGMQISPEQGALMRLLVELLGVARYLEVGVFTGYSSLAVALAMPPSGRITACDRSEEWTAMARRYWAEAGVADRIDLRLGPAIETLDALLAEGRAGTYDFAFIDADKANYGGYYERALKLVRTGGLIAIDNVLWNGAVVDPARSDADTEAIRTLNAGIAEDARVTVSLVPIGDGVTLARKR